MFSFYYALLHLYHNSNIPPLLQQTDSVVKKIRGPSKSPFHPATSCSCSPSTRVFLAVPLARTEHALSFSPKVTDWATWQEDRWSRPTLQHLPGPHYPAHLWPQQIRGGIRHSCVKQQASRRITAAKYKTALLLRLQESPASAALRCRGPSSSGTRRNVANTVALS